MHCSERVDKGKNLREDQVGYYQPYGVTYQACSDLSDTTIAGVKMLLVALVVGSSVKMLKLACKILLILLLSV